MKKLTWNYSEKSKSQKINFKIFVKTHWMSFAGHTQRISIRIWYRSVHHVDVLNGLEKKDLFSWQKKSDSRELISSCNCAVRTFLLIYWKVVYKKRWKITQNCSTNQGSFFKGIEKCSGASLIPSKSTSEGPVQQFQ